MAGGHGVLRARFRRFLEKQGTRLEFTLGEKSGGNPGHTTVRPVHPLPSAGAALSELVWDYCGQPKTMSKIAGQFRRYGNPQVQRAVRSLSASSRGGTEAAPQAGNSANRIKGSKNSVYQAV